MSTDKNLDAAYESIKAAREARGATLPLYFQFEWNGGLHRAEITRDDTGLILAMSLDCGALPFSAEAPEVRSRMIRLARQSTPKRYSKRGAVDQGGWFDISGQKRLRYRELTSFHGGLDSKAILTAAIVQVAKNRHMLDFARGLWN